MRDRRADDSGRQRAGHRARLVRERAERGPPSEAPGRASARPAGTPRAPADGRPGPSSERRAAPAAPRVDRAEPRTASVRSSRRARRRPRQLSDPGQPRARPAGPAARAGCRRRGAEARGTQITTLHPTTFNEARTIGEHFRDGVPVIMNLTEMDEAGRQTSGRLRRRSGLRPARYHGAGDQPGVPALSGEHPGHRRRQGEDRRGRVLRPELTARDSNPAVLSIDPAGVVSSCCTPFCRGPSRPVRHGLRDAVRAALAARPGCCRGTRSGLERH